MKNKNKVNLLKEYGVERKDVLFNQTYCGDQGFKIIFYNKSGIESFSLSRINFPNYIQTVKLTDNLVVNSIFKTESDLNDCIRLFKTSFDNDKKQYHLEDEIQRNLNNSTNLFNKKSLIIDQSTSSVKGIIKEGLATPFISESSNESLFRLFDDKTLEIYDHIYVLAKKFKSNTRSYRQLLELLFNMDMILHYELFDYELFDYELVREDLGSRKILTKEYIDKFNR